MTSEKSTCDELSLKRFPNNSPRQNPKDMKLTLKESFSEEEAFQNDFMELFVVDIVDGISKVILRPSTVMFIVGDSVSHDVIWNRRNFGTVP
jgi:hypothetical protein